MLVKQNSPFHWKFVGTLHGISHLLEPTSRNFYRATAFSLVTLSVVVMLTVSQMPSALESQETNTLLIPGRPVARFKHRDGERLDVAERYVQLVQDCARPLPNPPLFKHQEIELRLELYFACDDEDIIFKPVKWNFAKIPNADTAPGVILSALVNHLYRHVGQVNPLTVVRILKPSSELIGDYGESCAKGLAIIRWNGG